MYPCTIWLEKGKMKKIKIAQIGIGHDHACQVFETLKKMNDVFDVVGYAKVPEDDLDSEWTKKHFPNFSYIYNDFQQYSVDEILSMPDLDAVAIETYDLNLVKYAQMAADKGLHIHMDKAPGESAIAFEKLLSTIKDKHLAFSIGYMYRFNPSVQKLFDEINSGELGKIHSIDAEMSCVYPKDKRDWLNFFHGGMMQYLGCHLIDIIVRIMGKPKEIIPANICSGYQGTLAKDCCLAVLKYENSVATAKSSMGDYGGFVRRHIIINGEKKSIEIRPLEKAVIDERFLYAHTSKYTSYASENWSDSGEIIESENFGRYQKMLQYFAEMIRKEKEYIVPLETEALIHRCLLSACEIKFK